MYRAFLPFIYSICNVSLFFLFRNLEKIKRIFFWFYLKARFILENKAWFRVNGEHFLKWINVLIFFLLFAISYFWVGICDEVVGYGIFIQIINSIRLLFRMKFVACQLHVLQIFNLNLFVKRHCFNFCYDILI